MLESWGEMSVHCATAMELCTDGFGLEARWDTGKEGSAGDLLLYPNRIDKG